MTDSRPPHAGNRSPSMMSGSSSHQAHKGDFSPIPRFAQPRDPNPKGVPKNAYAIRSPARPTPTKTEAINRRRISGIAPPPSLISPRKANAPIKSPAMRAKLRQIKQQLRERMHDPVPQTGQWPQSIVQGHFNYYAVPGNLKSLGVFRDRVLALWWRTLRRRSQKHRINWTRLLILAQRWLPQPRALNPLPDARFAATHPR
jgi:hypothetical protein